jgi:hypothetical protein
MRAARGSEMEKLSEREVRHDTYSRLQNAIASNKRYLKELNQTADLQSYDEVYSSLIKAQERLLKEIY